MLRRPKSADFARTRAPIKRTFRTLLSIEQFRWAIERESLRVDRQSAGDLTLVLFRLAGSGSRRLSTVRLVKRILLRVRVCDDVGWFDKQHIGLLLPDTVAIGASQLAEEICDEVAKRGARPLITLYNYPASQKDVESSQEDVQKLKVAS